jgi:hypothetical protein
MARPRSKTSRRAAKPVVRSLSSRARKTALARFTRRTTDLFLGYVAAGRSSPKLIRAVRKLRDDIDSWGDRWGRKDIRTTAALVKQTGDGEWTCKNCGWIMVSMGRLCFLVGCDPEWKNCSYICIELPKDPNYPVS